MFAPGDAFASAVFGGNPLRGDVTRSALLLVGLLLVSLFAGTGVVSATEDPRFETYVGTETVAPGQTTQIAVTLVNDAEAVDERVDIAHDVQATMRPGDTPFTVTTGTQLLGTARDGQPMKAAFGLDVPRNAPSGTYDVPVEVTYEYDGDERETTTVYATIRIVDRPTFEVVETRGAPTVDGTGSVAVTVENVGSEAATDATVELTSKSAALAFGTQASTNRFAGTWEPSEEKTLVYDLTATQHAETRPYSLTAHVAYDDGDGERRRSVPLTANVTPAPAGTFSVTEHDSSLAVGEDGTIRVTVHNDGSTVAGNAVVRLVGENGGVVPDRREYAVGSLATDENATATFPVDVSDDADAAPRYFEFVVTYDEPDGERVRSITYGTQVEIAPERDRFDVAVTNTSIPAGNSGTVTLSVTNTGNEPLEAVDAKAYTDAPYSITDDAAFVGTLSAGETTTVAFDVAVPDGAAGKQYPLSLDLKYETPDGDTEISDTYDVPVRVTESTGPALGTMLLAGGIVLAVVLVLGRWYTRD